MRCSTTCTALTRHSVRELQASRSVTPRVSSAKALTGGGFEPCASLKREAGSRGRRARTMRATDRLSVVLDRRQEKG